jgi:membrane fusion protein, multidrug efflux system
MPQINEFSITRRMLLLVIFVCLFCLGCQQKKKPEVVEFKIPVTVEEVARQDIEDLFIATGTVRAPEIITLNVEIDGALQIAKGRKGRLAEGDAVKAGELIARIIGEDVRLTANIEVAKKKLEIAKRNLDAANIVFERKFLSIADYGSYRSQYEDALHDYDTSKYNEDSSSLITPIDGIILTLARNKGQPMANGQLVKQGQMIAQIASLKSLLVDVDIVGKDIARVRPGLPVKASYHAWDGRRFDGHVLRLSPTIDEKTRALRAEVEISNSDGLLRPGMFVEVALIAEKREQVAVIPRYSLTQRGGRRVVFVVNGERVEQRNLELGLDNGKFVEVRKGLNVGEKVVVLGLETLADQMPVRITAQ